MKANKFTYDVEVFVDFTDDELELLRGCCAGHYDGLIKASVKRGGFLYGWINMRDMDIDICCSFHQLDVCAKALDLPLKMTETEKDSKVRWNLRGAIMKTLRSLNEEISRLSMDNKHHARVNSSAEWVAGERDAKITAPDGTIVFEGNISMFRDCFFDGATDWANVTAWAKTEGLVAKLA